MVDPASLALHPWEGSLGKQIRMKRLIKSETNNCLICALDHGLTSLRFLNGLFDTEAWARKAIAGGANVLMLSPGMAKRVVSEFRPDTALALMLSASAAGHPEDAFVIPIGSVQQALKLGADAVVCYVALEGRDEGEMITYVSSIGEACDEVGMPFIAEAEFPNSYQSLEEQVSGYGANYLQRNARLCAELGARLTKTH